MAEYWIEDAELSYMFRNAKDSAGQVKILAELCAVPVEEMRRKLRSMGLNVPEGPRGNRRKLDYAAAERLYMRGLSDREIAERLDVETGTVKSWRQSMGLAITKDRRRRLDEAEAMRLYRRGANDREISMRLGVVHASVVAWRKRRGLESQRARRKISDGL